MLISNGAPSGALGWTDGWTVQHWMDGTFEPTYLDGHARKALILPLRVDVLPEKGRDSRGAPQALGWMDGWTDLARGMRSVKGEGAGAWLRRGRAASGAGWTNLIAITK